MRAFHHALSWLGVAVLFVPLGCTTPSSKFFHDAVVSEPTASELAEELAGSVDDEPTAGAIVATVAAWPKKLRAQLVTLPLEEAELPSCGRAQIERQLAACLNGLIHRHAADDVHLTLEITAVSPLRRFEITEPVFIFARRHVTIRGRRVDGRLITLAAAPALRRPPVSELQTYAEKNLLERLAAGSGVEPRPSSDRDFMFHVVDSEDVHLIDLRLDGGGLAGLHALGVCPTTERRVSHVSVERSLVRGFRGAAVVLGQSFAAAAAIERVGTGLGQSRFRAYAARRAGEKVTVTCSGFVSQVAFVDNTFRLLAPALAVVPGAKTRALVEPDPLDWTQTPDLLARDNHTITVRNNRFIVGARAEAPHVLGLANVQRVTVANNHFRADGGSVVPVQVGAGVGRLDLAANHVDGAGGALTQAR